MGADVGALKPGEPPGIYRFSGCLSVFNPDTLTAGHKHDLFHTRHDHHQDADGLR